MCVWERGCVWGCVTRSIFKWSLTSLTLEFSFSETGCLTKAKEPSLPNYLPKAGGRIIGFILFPIIVVLCEMQSASSRIWTHLAASIFYDDNHCTTSASMCVCVCVCVCVCYNKKKSIVERPRKLSSDNDSEVRHGFGTNSSCPQTQTVPVISNTITRLCRFSLRSWDIHTHTHIYVHARVGV